MEKVSYRNIKLGEVSSPPPPAMYSSLYLKKQIQVCKKKKCNSSMTMHAILNVLRIVLLNIVYNGTMRFIYQHILVHICLFNNSVRLEF